MDLEWVRIVDKNQYFNLALIFKQETEFVMMIPTEPERERLLSVLMTVRSLALTSSGHVE